MTTSAIPRSADKSEQVPRDEALRRADDMLRTMLNTPPSPHAPKKKSKRRAKKASK